jgi:membrane protein YqaA with SNARE-associated domain
MIAALALFAFAAGGGVGYSLGRWGSNIRQDAALDRRLDEFRINEQQRLLAEAREAHYRGELGLAQTLEDAADRVMTRGLGK